MALEKGSEKILSQLNKECLLSEMKRYKKLDHDTCVTEHFQRKPYFFELNLEQVQDKYRILNNMVETVRGNFPSKYRNTSLECQSCKNGIYDVNVSKRDSQTHLLEECPVFNDLRGKCDLQSDLAII